MADRGNDAPFPEKLFALLLGGEHVSGHLERDALAALEVLGLVRLPHAAPAEQLDQAKAAECLTWAEHRRTPAHRRLVYARLQRASGVSELRALIARHTSRAHEA